MKFVTTLIAAASVVAMASAAQAAETYRIGGGPAGGGWHPSVSAGAQMLNTEVGDKFKFNYSPSNGSVDNVRRTAYGKFDTAWGHVGQVYQAWNGVGLFKEDGKLQDFRIIANVRKQSQIVAVLADSPIKSYSDMKGKIVNLLNNCLGSGMLGTAVAIEKAGVLPALALILFSAGINKFTPAYSCCSSGWCRSS